MKNKNNIKVIAFYLPQFHPTEVNDKYWGKGFTEWTNVAKAKPLFKGHYQPQIPADLGFYDLRLPEIREEQAKMAKEYDIYGFCYWNYWFGNGEKTLEMPIEEVTKSGKPDFPFCVGWANHDWSNKTWEKSGKFQKDVVFFKQKYLGEKDYTDYFNYLLPMFKDRRYINVDGRPLFYIFEPENVPDIDVFIKTFNENAKKNGLDGIYFVGRADAIGKMKLHNEKGYLDERIEKRYKEFFAQGFDAVNSFTFRRAEIIANGIFQRALRKLKKKVTGSALTDYDYEKVVNNLITEEDKWENVYPTICPRKDRTPRSGKDAWLYRNSSPEKFKKSVINAVDVVKNKKPEHRIIFLDSWNEWGEGAYMEPDLRFGHKYLDALREGLDQ